MSDEVIKNGKVNTSAVMAWSFRMLLLLLGWIATTNLADIRGRQDRLEQKLEEKSNQITILDTRLPDVSRRLDAIEERTRSIEQLLLEQARREEHRR